METAAVEARWKLHTACQDGDVGCVKEILKAPVLGFEDVNDEDKLGYQTPLQWAADGGFSKICAMLVDAGADPDCSGAHPDCFAPLHLAALNGNLEVVQTLVTAGANIEVEGENDTAPIHLAAQEGHSTVVAKLAECGANMEIRDGDFDTPLHLAACGTDGKGHLEVVETLLKVGADPRAKRRNGKTAGMTTKNKALRELLLAAETSFDETQAIRLTEERQKLMATSLEDIEKEKKRREKLLAAKRKALAPLQLEPNKNSLLSPPAKASQASPPAKRKSPKRPLKVELVPSVASKKPKVASVEGFPGWEARTTPDGTFYVDLSNNEIHWNHPSQVVNKLEVEKVQAPQTFVVKEEPAIIQMQEDPTPVLREPAAVDPKREILLQAIFKCGPESGKEEATLQEIVTAANKMSGETYATKDAETLCEELMEQNRVMIDSGVVYYVI